MKDGEGKETAQRRGCRAGGWVGMPRVGTRTMVSVQAGREGRKEGGKQDHLHLKIYGHLCGGWCNLIEASHGVEMKDVVDSPASTTPIIHSNLASILLLVISAVHLPLCHSASVSVCLYLSLCRSVSFSAVSSFLCRFPLLPLPTFTSSSHYLPSSVSSLPGYSSFCPTILCLPLYPSVSSSLCLFVFSPACHAESASE